MHSSNRLAINRIIVIASYHIPISVYFIQMGFVFSANFLLFGVGGAGVARQFSVFPETGLALFFNICIMLALFVGGG